MKMKKHLLIILLPLLTLMSCAKSSDFEMISFDDVIIHSTSRVDILLTVRNSSRKNFEFKDLTMTVFNGEKKMADVILIKPVLLKKRTESSLTIPLRIKWHGNSLLSMAFDNNALDFSDYVVSGQAQVKLGAIKRKIKFEREYVNGNLATFEDIF